MTEAQQKLSKKLTEALQEGMLAFAPAFMNALKERGVVLGLEPEKQLSLVDPDGKPV